MKVARVPVPIMEDNVNAIQFVMIFVDMMNVQFKDAFEHG